jgi:hypothetical protein
MSGGMKLIGWLLAAAALAVGSGCARPDWIEQTLVTVDVSGVWRGTVEGDVWVVPTLVFTLEQRGAKVTGNLSVTSFQWESGPIEGTVSGDIFRFRTMRGQVSGELKVEGDEMTGPGSGVIGGQVAFRLLRQP